MSELGDTIRAARLARGLDQVELGREFGVTKSAVNQWESGKNVPDQRKLQRLAQILGLDPALIVRLAASPGTVQGTATGATAAAQAPSAEPGPEATANLPSVRMTPVPLPVGAADVPVWASAQAGEDGALVLTPDPIDYIHRSERMRDVRNPFAFYVVGSSMSPAIEHADQVVVNPSLPVRPGGDCVFIQQQPDGTFLALVKRLVRQNADQWRVRQYNPPRDYDLSRKKWSRAHVISEIRRGGL